MITFLFSLFSLTAGGSRSSSTSPLLDFKINFSLPNVNLDHLSLVWVVNHPLLIGKLVNHAPPTLPKPHAPPTSSNFHAPSTLLAPDVTASGSARRLQSVTDETGLSSLQADARSPEADKSGHGTEMLADLEKRRRYPDCADVTITLNMFMRFLKTGRLCGSHAYKVRFGLG